MSEDNNKKTRSCPPKALFRPSLFRIFYLPFNFLVCWALVLFKARASDSFPYGALFAVTVFILVVFGLEVAISSKFSPFLVPVLWGFLGGAGVNALFQVLLSNFKGLTWAFQSPIQWSLGTVLFGFLGSLIFLSRSSKVNQVFLALLRPDTQKQENSLSYRTFAAFLWVVTGVLAAGLCLSLSVIQRQYASMQTSNPLRKPLWFAVGSVILIAAVVILARKNISRLGFILLPGVVYGLLGAFVIRDIFEGVYLLHSDFFLAPEVLEAALILSFCYLGIAWFNHTVFTQSEIQSK